MAVTDDHVALNEWIVCGWPEKVEIGESYRTFILGQEIRVARYAADEFVIFEYDEDGHRGRQLPVQTCFRCIFTTLGEPTRPLPKIKEFGESDRRLVSCGSVGVNTSPYRVIENFLDMAHFPFLHAGILGAKDHTEVFSYKAEHRKDIDEIWATDCQFFQPLASRASSNGKMTYYTYRIMSPFSAMFYKGNAKDEARSDALCLFVQPLGETECLAYTPMALLDESSTMTSLIDFQQTIFLQDRIILENQRPALLPMDPSMETPTRADASSIAFRRWLKGMGLQFGVYEKAAV